MDLLDHSLLQALTRDGRVSNKQLAKDVGLSESATLARVKRLEDKQIINGYTATINPEKVGRSLQVFMAISLSNQESKRVQDITETLAGFDETLSLVQLLGRYDFIAHIAVKDVEALRYFINTKLIPLDGIEHMESFTVLETVKHSNAPLPLGGHTS